MKGIFSGIVGGLCLAAAFEEAVTTKNMYWIALLAFLGVVNVLGCIYENMHKPVDPDEIPEDKE